MHFFTYTGTKIRSVLMYNATSGDREGKVCHIDAVGSVIGMCTIQVSQVSVRHVELKMRDGFKSVKSQ